MRRLARHSFVFLVIATSALAASGQLSAPPTAPMPAHTIVPTPASVSTTAGGDFIATPATVIVVPPNNEAVAKVGAYLLALIGFAAGPEPPKVVPADGSTPAGAIHLALGRIEAAGDEGYASTITANAVRIAANTPAGLFYGVQTLRQRLPAFIDYKAIRADKAFSVDDRKH